MTPKEVIEQMSAELIWKKRDNGTKYVCREELKEDYIRDIIYEAHDKAMPNDTTYEFIYRIVNHLNDCDCEDIDSMRESIYEIESDVYTSDLTAWLNASNSHVYYLTEVLEERDTKDGFQLLSMAQHRHIEEIGNNLLNAIEKHCEEEEE